MCKEDRKSCRSFLFMTTLVKGAYGKSKAETTLYVEKARQHGFPVSVVHPSGIIGPGDYSGGYMTELMRFSIHHGMPLAVEGGYDFVDVRDVADGIIRCADEEMSGENYILSNEYITVKHLLDILSKQLGKRKPYGSVPLKWMEIIAPFCEKMFPVLKLPELITPYSIYTLGSNGHRGYGKEAGSSGTGSGGRVESL